MAKTRLCLLLYNNLPEPVKYASGLLPLPLQNHFTMKNPCFVENRTDGVKMQGFVEANDRNLCMQINPPGAESDCNLDGALQ
jgi:hypothetical protein